MLNHALQLFKDTAVASIAPTSTRCVRAILKSVDFTTAKLIIEFGPGDGAFTAPILTKLGPDAKLVVIETNEEFVAILRTRTA